MAEEIKYFLSETGDGFDAIWHGKKIGEITYVRVGNDKMIIDYTGVDPDFRHQNVGLNLVRNAVDMARQQHRHVIAMCPFARAMFNRYSEFDDVRLLNHH